MKNRTNRILLIALLLLIYVPAILIVAKQYTGFGINAPQWAFWIAAIPLLPILLTIYFSPVIIVCVIVYKVMERRRK